MKDFSINPREMVSSVWRNRNLIKVLVQREVIGRYRGATLGLLWSFFNPVFMLVIYTFVFSVVFKSRWSSTSSSKTEFALVLFAGLIVFNFFAECVNRAPGLILSNANYVKKVVFPLEILPWVSLGSAAFHAAISLAVWLLAYMLLFGAPPLTGLWLPLVLLPLPLYILGLTWLLSALGVYLRDVSQVIGTITMIMMFVSPIFYPTTALPEDYRWLLQINPLTPVVEQVRNVLFWGNSPDLTAITIDLIFGGLVAWLGFAWFQKTRKGFADVI